MCLYAYIYYNIQLYIMSTCGLCGNTSAHYINIYVNDNHPISLCNTCSTIRKIIWPNNGYICYDKDDDNYDKYCSENVLEKIDNDMKKLFSDKYYFEITYKIFELEHSGECSDNDEPNNNESSSNYYKNEYTMTFKKPILKSLPIKNYDKLDIDIFDYKGLYCYMGDEFGTFYSPPHEHGSHSCGSRRTFCITKLKIKPIIIL